MVRFQRNELKNSGVEIYHNTKDKYHIVTPHLQIKAPCSSDASLTLSTSKRIGDILRAIEFKSENSDQKLILTAIYIKDIEIFTSKALFP